MFKRKIKLILLVLQIILIFSSTSKSQSQVEDFKPTSISAGYGGSLVVKVRDPSAVYWNPALLNSLKDRELLLDINKPFGFNFIGFTQFVPLYGTFGFALSRFSTSTDNVDRGTISWGRSLFNRLSWGVNFDLAKLQDDWYATAGWGLFLGNPNVGSLDYRWHDFNNSSLLDKLNFGFTLQNIPINQKLFETTARLGLSYLLPTKGILLNTGYHLRKGHNTIHLGLGFELNRKITLFTGVQEFDFDKWGIGLAYSRDNFRFNFTYSAELEKILLSLSARLSAKPSVSALPYYQRGSNYLKSGKYKFALKELKKYLFFDLHEARFDTVRSLARALEIRVAKRQFVIDSLYTAASQLSTQGKTESLKAALILSKILELDKDNVRANMKLLSLKPAIKEFIDKTLFEGASEFESENYKRAENSFKRVLLFEETNKSALSYLLNIKQIYEGKSENLFYQGVGYFQQKKYEKAKEAFNQALDFNPAKQEAQIYLNRTLKNIKENEQKIIFLFQAGQSLEKRGKYIAAIKKYEEILEIDNENVEAENKIAQLKPKERVEKRTLIQKREKALTSLNQAEEAFRQEDWDTALKLYSEVLLTYPKDAKAVEGKRETEKKIQIVNLLKDAKSDFGKENYLKAFNKYKKVLELEPKNDRGVTGFNKTKNKMDELVETYFNEGINLYTLDRYKEAIEKWNQVLELNPNHKGSLEYKKQAQERLTAIKKIK